VPDEPAAYALKVLLQDGSSLRRFHLPAGEHLVGSAPEASVSLDLPGVSRRHASLKVLPDGGVVVTDLGSKNGTFVAGRPVREAAVAGFTVLAFGAVQALLQPGDPSRSDVLLEPPQGAATPERARRAPTTVGLHPVERLAESLEEVLLPLLGEPVRREEIAMALTERWIEVLPVGRVEILSGADAVVAAASTAHRVPKATASLDLEGAGGWKIRVRAPASVKLAPLAPLFRLALGLLETLPGRWGWRDRTNRPDRSDRTDPSDRPRAAPETPPPAGLGPEMTRIYRQAGKVARGDVPVLILGESGSGKEVLARWVHERSRRASGPFLAVNCAALPRELLESELFGIEKGVATGVEARPGLLERGTGGTVFLDEVGDMAPETQAKVLRVLENTSLFRVGGRAPVPVDVRFVAATNRDLEVLVEEGGFRRDLFHRLAAFQVKLPPLRERREEIPGLAARFFHREIEKNGIVSPGITRATLGALVRHPWPGNVRELQNEIAKAALLLEPGEPLDLQHLSDRVRRPPGESASPSLSLTLDETVQRAEREAFAVALAAAGGDAARAMAILGVSRTTYYRKMKELGLGEPSPPGE
jgi:DNA-binding NtrC family response regulator/pSer/pThr/pTyr-binding forkhead associated (FHA) protein